MAGLLSITRPQQTFLLAYEGENLKGIVAITADTLTKAKAIARKRYTNCQITEWNPDA